MQLPSSNSEFKNTNDFIKDFLKYIYFWKYFVISIVVFLLFSLLFLRYTTEIYTSEAKIRILDKSPNTLILPSAEEIFGNSKINLENEIEVIKSFKILNKVALKLNLFSEVYELGEVKESLSLYHPFSVKMKTEILNFNNEYKFYYKDNLYIIFDVFNDKEYEFKDIDVINTSNDFPFIFTNFNSIDFVSNNFEYLIKINSNKNVVKKLRSNLKVSTLGKKSEILLLSYNSEVPKYSEDILNTLINVFNNDGVNDRQLVHKRTIDFVNKRFLYISTELDSIEKFKQNYKADNRISDLKTDLSFQLESSLSFNDKEFQNLNQIELTEMLISDLSNTKLNLLPSNVGVNNTEINTLINEFNSRVLSLNKIQQSAGSNNPSLLIVNNQLIELKKNILLTLENFLAQLIVNKNQLLSKSNRHKTNIENLPKNEKNLRAIERSQKIKETLYLFLLERREEAEVNLAITEPSIKIVDYASSSYIPIFPIRIQVFLISVLIGLLLPFLILSLIFYFDTKIKSREDFEKLSLNVLAEIPFFDIPELEKVFSNPDDRSIISESFRMLMSNVRYFKKNDSTSNVILVTSSIKGEGKTLNALNLALSFSSVGEKVLLIGCDLRNPQLHRYIEFEKNVPGLVDYLVDSTTEWKKNIINPFESQNLDILLSGPIPPNPLNLINNGNIDKLLKDARKIYDHIIIDSAPTLLVADTKSLINKSDILIFLTRCNVTDREVLNHIKKVSDESDSNVGVILNGVGQKNSYGYSYGYRYGYGYNYKYSYNYGYGYGYNEESS
jgi:capsular exopolysaccharide synthesis family protein